MTGAGASSGGLSVEGLHSPLAGPFDLAVAPGECLAVTGPSGSGKSLLLRMIADLDPNEGAVTLNGRDRASSSAPAWRGRAVYVAADAGWWADGVTAHFDPSHRAAAQSLADRLGLKAELFDGLVSRLSTGERQRLALIRALVRRPQLLLLDELTGSLDGESVILTEAVLRERMAAGLILILVTHDPAQAVRMGDQRRVMGAGRLSPP